MPVEVCGSDFSRRAESSKSASDSLEVAVWRGGAEGRLVTYRVPARPSQTVLDLVTYIQRYLDGGLAYRFACRVGMCGSCAMTVNGVARWTCRTRVATVVKNRRLEVRPLENLPPIKDLVVDMTPFFEKWSRAHGHFIAPDGTCPDQPFAMVPPETAKRRAADAGIECIGCGVCYASCDVVAWNRDYLGPAALNRAWTLINDVRDGALLERLRSVAGDAGCHACHSLQSCVERCPKQLNPTASIAGLKRAVLKAAWKGEL